MKEQKLTNLDYLNELTGGEAEFTKEMINLFLDQIVEFQSELRGYYANQQYKELGELAHKAKSSVVTFGMDDLGRRLKELQLKTQKLEDIDSYESYVLEFEEHTKQAAAELKEQLAQL